MDGESQAEEEAGVVLGRQQQGVKGKVQQEEGTIKECWWRMVLALVFCRMLGVAMGQGGGDGLFSEEETRLTKERPRQRRLIS